MEITSKQTENKQEKLNKMHNSMYKFHVMMHSLSRLLYKLEVKPFLLRLLLKENMIIHKCSTLDCSLYLAYDAAKS